MGLAMNRKGSEKRGGILKDHVSDLSVRTRRRSRISGNTSTRRLMAARAITWRRFRDRTLRYGHQEGAGSSVSTARRGLARQDHDLPHVGGGYSETVEGVIALREGGGGDKGAGSIPGLPPIYGRGKPDQSERCRLRRRGWSRKNIALILPKLFESTRCVGWELSPSGHHTVSPDEAARWEKMEPYRLFG